MAFLEFSVGQMAQRPLVSATYLHGPEIHIWGGHSQTDVASVC